MLAVRQLLPDSGIDSTLDSMELLCFSLHSKRKYNRSPKLNLGFTEMSQNPLILEESDRCFNYHNVAVIAVIDAVGASKRTAIRLINYVYCTLVLQFHNNLNIDIGLLK